MLGSSAEQKPCDSPAVLVQQPTEQRSPAYPGLPPESQEVGPCLLPEHNSLSAAHRAQIIKPPQHRMGTAKPPENHLEPADNQVRGHVAIRIYRHRCAKEATLASLPAPIRQKQRSNNRAYRVMKIANQLDRQQRKAPPTASAYKAGNGNPLLSEARKQLNGISPVGSDLPIAIKAAAYGTGGPNEGVKIDLMSQERFFVFPNRFEFVNVGELNWSAALPMRVQVFRLVHHLNCSLIGLGCNYKVNFLTRLFVHPYIIGHNTL
jgi:hypothetical protein